MFDSATFQNEQFQASGWTIAGDFSAVNYVTQCGDYKIVGGNGLFGANALLTKTYNELPPHLNLRISFFLMKIAYWNQNNFILQVDEKTVFTKTFETNEDSNSFKVCQTGSYNDALRPVDIYVSHSEAFLTIKMTSDLTTGPTESSWGIFNLTVAIYLCDSSCKTCQTENDANKCMTCGTGKYLQALIGPSQCLDKCPSHSYPDDLTNICQICHTSCKECTSSGSQNCTKCDTKSYLFLPPGPSACSISCNLDYYPDDSTGECKKCDQSCASCSDSGSNSCLSCKNNTYLQNLTGPSQCLSNCPEHTYPDNKTNICQKCDTSCNECFDYNFDKCTKCYSKYYLVLPPGPSLCSVSCNIGYYPDDSSNECKKCDESCENCLGLGQDNCSSCLNGSYLQELKGPSQCLINCPNHTYPENKTNICTKCEATCKECSSSAKESCTECYPKTYLLAPPGPSSCDSSCNSGYYADDISNECRRCDQSCKECSEEGPNQCFSCPQESYLQNLVGPSQCLGGCPNHTYPDNQTNICQKCDPSCDECFLSGNYGCRKCFLGKYLLYPPGPSICLDICFPGYYPDSIFNECKLCDISCKECVSSHNSSCIKCNQGTYLLSIPGPSFCVNKSSCPMNNYANLISNQCELCDVSCLTCSNGSKYDCLLCSGAYFYDEINLSCEKCHSSCLSCNGPNFNSCLSCFPGKLLQNITGPSSCENICPQGYYLDLSNFHCSKDCPRYHYKNDDLLTCEPCHYSCESCLGPAFNNCISCDNFTRTFKENENNSFPITGECSCIESYYDDGGSRMCFRKYI